MQASPSVLELFLIPDLANCASWFYISKPHLSVSPHQPSIFIMEIFGNWLELERGDGGPPMTKDDIAVIRFGSIETAATFRELGDDAKSL